MTDTSRTTARALNAMLAAPRWRLVALRAIRDALAAAGGDASQAAQELGITVDALRWILVQVPEADPGA